MTRRLNLPSLHALLLGLIAMLWYLPLESAAYCFPGMMLATFYTYNLLGTRFIHALLINVAVLLLYNALFGVVREFPEAELLSQNFFLISANLIGGAAGYLAEFHRRQLFLREVQLDDERQLHLNRSLHDRLTGLPNRDRLDDRINQALALARRDQARHAGFFVDLDGFKHINDRLGHDHGDIVLRSVARRLESVMRETETISRIGGDEFFVLIQDIGSCDSAAHLAEKLRVGGTRRLPQEPCHRRGVGCARSPNAQWQRDLSVSHNKIGDVLVALGDGRAALAAYSTSLSTAEALAAHDPANAQWQRDLSVSHNKIGDVLVALGDGPVALASHRKRLATAEALAAHDPANAQWQRDLSVSHDRIGDVLVALGDGPAALAAYHKSLAIREALAELDPANAQWQRDLSVSRNKIGDVLVALGDGPAALACCVLQEIFQLGTSLF